MQYLCYKEKKNPDVLIKIEYKGDMDIKFIAALTFIIGKWWMDTSLSLVIDAIQWDLERDKIMNTFDLYCIVVDDVLNTLNKKVVTVADLFPK